MSCDVLFEVLEQSSIKVTITAVDENDAALVRSDFNTAQWQLMRSDGYVVNNRSFKNTQWDSTTAFIFFLTGNDLVTYEGEDNSTVERIIEFQGTYDTNIGGDPVSDVSVAGSFNFKIIRRKGTIQEVILTLDGISQTQGIDELILP